MQLIKVPRINALGKTGPEKAPNFILAELKNNYRDFSKLNLEEIHVDNSNIAEAEHLVYKNSKEEFEKQDFLIFIGGDHSISYPTVKAFNETFEDAFLIVFDAHADCMRPTKNPTHEEWLRAVIEQGFNPENIILIGTRKLEPEEKIFLEKNKIKYYSEVENKEIVADIITEKANGKNIYVSIDIDVLDPAFAPAVNYPEPLGLNTKDFFYLLRRIFHIQSIKAIDIVEVIPLIDEKNGKITIKTASKIIQEFLERK